MRHALVIAGGSGTRLWPMSRSRLPKQLIPFIGGDPPRSLLQLAMDRLEGLIPRGHQYICAGQGHEELILATVKGAGAERFFGEPMGRDTLNAVGLGAALIMRDDPQAVVAVFSADHIIEPVGTFQKAIDLGFRVAEQYPNALVTFGAMPTHAATGYGYVELGEELAMDGGDGVDSGLAGPRLVKQFKEKPDSATAGRYVAAGPERFLWNSGMFVWRAATLLDCIKRYAPENYAGLQEIAGAWGGDQREETIERVYPKLKKISVDYAVMEPASRDAAMRVVCVGMPGTIRWVDVGSWPSFAGTCEKDAAGNAVSPAHGRHLLVDTRETLAASSDAGHLIATIGCEGLMIIHTPDATLVCRADRAEDIKKLHAMLGEKYGNDLL